MKQTALASLYCVLALIPVRAVAGQTAPLFARAQVWATLDERDLVPEGTAWDPASRSVLFGSLNKNTIVAVTLDGTVSDRVPRGSHGLASVAGIHVDTIRHTLWVASNPRYDRPDDTTRSALFAFDPRNGAFKAKYLAPLPGPHFLNDITTTGDGTVYITDTRRGNVLVLAAGDSVLRPFTSLGQLRFPNGITVSDDSRFLFVVAESGVTVADLRANRVWRLDGPDSMRVANADGLAFSRGALVAHHPGADGHIARYQLDAGFRRGTRREILEGGSPDVRTSTTGEVVGDHYVFIGNSQIDRMNARTLDAATMQPIRLYRMPLALPANGVVAVSLSARDSVALFDALTLERTSTLPVGNDPHEIASSPDGTRAYVANAGDSSISVIDAAPRPRISATWRLPDTLRVHDVAVSTDGRSIWGISGAHRMVLEIDAPTGTTKRRFPISRPGGWMIQVSSPGAPIVIGNLEGGAVTLLSPQSGTETVLEAREGEIDAAATPDGSEIWSVNLRDGQVSIFGRDGARRERIASGKGAGRVIFTPEGRTALVVNGGDSTITAFDVQSRRLVATIHVPHDPKVIALSRNGRRAYVSHPERGALTMIDLGSFSLLRTVAVPGTPDGVAVLEPRN